MLIHNHFNKIDQLLDLLLIWRTGAAVAQAKANHTKVCSILRSFEEQEAQAQIQLSKALDLLNLVAAEEALDGPEVLAVLEDMLGPEWAAAALPAANKED